MSRRGWSAADVPDQTGRTVIVTGANSGLGLETTRVLAGKGATVIMACRSLGKAEAAQADVLASHPSAKLEVRSLDLADLSSIRGFAEAIKLDHPKVQLLINNAGIMAIPRSQTVDGFEMQLGTNHFGHFALTGLLLQHLAESGPARIVTVSSAAHKMGRMHFDDLQLSQSYGEWKSYGQSKLANLLFAFELDRRLRGADLGVTSLAAHPGYSNTNLQSVGPKVSGNKLMGAIMRLGNQVMAQGADQGALPSLRAAIDPKAEGGQYYGPSGILEVAGPPVVVKANEHARDAADANRLWEISEELTGVRYTF
ncbi:MAG: oxidoreductase [Myxococcota bacterium]